MFMTQSTELWNSLDLDRRAHPRPGLPGSRLLQALAELASITEEDGVPKAKDMIRQLVAGQEAVARTARQVFAWWTRPPPADGRPADPAHGSA